MVLKDGHHGSMQTIPRLTHVAHTHVEPHNHLAPLPLHIFFVHVHPHANSPQNLSSHRAKLTTIEGQSNNKPPPWNHLGPPCLHLPPQTIMKPHTHLPRLTTKPATPTAVAATSVQARRCSPCVSHYPNSPAAVYSIHWQFCGLPNFTPPPSSHPLRRQAPSLQEVSHHRCSSPKPPLKLSPNCSKPPPSQPLHLGRGDS